MPAFFRTAARPLFAKDVSIHHRTLRALLPALAALPCLGHTSAWTQNTIHVPADQPTIQAGINAAQNGDTVLVAPGKHRLLRQGNHSYELRRTCHNHHRWGSTNLYRSLPIRRTPIECDSGFHDPKRWQAPEFLLLARRYWDDQRRANHRRERHHPQLLLRHYVIHQLPTDSEQ